MALLDSADSFFFFFYWKNSRPRKVCMRAMLKWNLTNHSLPFLKPFGPKGGKTAFNITAWARGIFFYDWVIYNSKTTLQQTWPSLSKDVRFQILQVLYRPPTVSYSYLYPVQSHNLLSPDKVTKEVESKGWCVSNSYWVEAMKNSYRWV